MKHVFVSHPTHSGLSLKINQEIEAGYIPIGTPFRDFDTNEWCQSMVSKEVVKTQVQLELRCQPWEVEIPTK